MIFLYILVLIVGFVGLVKGADLFVDGSAKIAGNLGVSGLIIGLTIVALGTSAPELAVSTTAAIQGSNEIALSNVVGSNIFNLLGVLGFCAILSPLPVDKSALKRDFPISIANTVLLLLLTCSGVLFSGEFTSHAMADNVGDVNRLTSGILLVLFLCYILYLIHTARKNPDEDPDRKKEPMKKCLLLLLIGVVLIIGGGQAVVYSAKKIARFFGMTETLIGLTVVALGTSLPELVTSLVAAKKGETDLAIGNAIGSNIFNLMFILGISSMIHPIGVNMASLCDMFVLIGISVMTLIFASTSKKIGRLEGAVMVLVYAADVVFAILR